MAHRPSCLRSPSKHPDPLLSLRHRLRRVTLALGRVRLSISLLGGLPDGTRRSGVFRKTTVVSFHEECWMVMISFLLLLLFIASAFVFCLVRILMHIDDLRDTPERRPDSCVVYQNRDRYPDRAIMKVKPLQSLSINFLFLRSSNSFSTSSAVGNRHANPSPPSPGKGSHPSSILSSSCTNNVSKASFSFFRS